MLLPNAENFLFNQPGNHVSKIFQELILKTCKGVAYHDQVETVLEICKDFMKLEFEVGYSSYF